LHTADDIAVVASRLAAATRVTVLTGAGVSVASGVPTFRGPDGLWRRFRPEELATPQAFARDPELVWQWYDWRRGLIAACRPNRAHLVLAAWSRHFPHFTLITQNVDGLHEAALTRHLVCLHGSIWDVKCDRPCAAGAKPWRDDRVPIGERLPRCPHCGSLLRPAVVWFGESLDPAVLERANAAADCDVFLAIGTSAVVYPAASLLPAARRRGACTVEINPAVTEASGHVDFPLAGAAEIVLDEIDRAMR
jgi:NAD-dependent deacetylase